MMGSLTNVLLLMFFVLFFHSAHTKKPLVHSSSESRCIETERQALLEFKASLVADSSSLSSWTGHDCCSWHGITCHNLTGHVHLLRLGGYTDGPDHSVYAYNHFNSSLSPWLFNLTHLEVLSMPYCGLRGPIPNMFDKLTSLTNLDLSLNVFGSAFPDSLCSLTSLIYMNLSGIQLQGSLPSCLGNLTSLTELYMDLNEFSGEIPGSLGNLTHLNTLFLSSNNFDSSIPSSFGHLQDLEFMFISDNQLTGTIPSTLGNLTKLKWLLVDDNQLTGTIPSTLGNLTKLEWLYVYDNSLVGELSESVLGGLESLEQLDISRNHRLVFNVSPQWIPPFQLSVIVMDSIFIGTRLPPWLQTQKNLESLTMRNASIFGAIPDWFLTASPDLYHIDLSDNLLTRFIPDYGCLTAIPKLAFFNLSNNLLTGSIPDRCQTAFPNLNNIDLSNNFLTGPVPTFDNASMMNLLLSRNQFENIPQRLCNLTSLGILSLGYNHLMGMIPSCLGALRGLNVLDMGNNNLSGHVPNELGSLSNLIILHLNGNNFSGELPGLWQNMTSLMILDLGYNQLHGSISQWIGKEYLPNLQYLRLESNNFSGEISVNICQLAFLQILNLAHNNLVGIIPPCMGNLSKMLSAESGNGIVFLNRHYDEALLNIMKGRQMEYTSSLQYAKFISLSGNHLYGEIPDELINLKGLQSLNLSNNELTGRIPERIDNMKHLESLDLSTNRLSGTIPQSLANIDALSYLNLSFNRLAGKVPSGNHFDTLDDPSIYHGNVGLCGKLLMKSCPGDSSPNGPVSDGDDEFDQLSWLYAGIGPGFAVGFLAVIFILYLKDQWRIAYFVFADNVYNKVRVTLTIKMSTTC